MDQRLRGHCTLLFSRGPDGLTIGQPLGRSCLVAVCMPPTGRKWSPSVPISDRAKYLRGAILHWPEGAVILKQL